MALSFTARELAHFDKLMNKCFFKESSSVLSWWHLCLFKYSQCEQFTVSKWTKGILVCTSIPRKAAVKAGALTEKLCVLLSTQFKSSILFLHSVNWLSPEFWRLYWLSCGQLWVCTSKRKKKKKRKFCVQWHSPESKHSISGNEYTINCL